MSISRRAALASFLPVAAVPGLASAAMAPADPALTAYRSVRTRFGTWGESDEAVEAWCQEEIDALHALAEQNPGGLSALLNRLVVLAERMDGDTPWNMMDCEADLLRSLGEQARAMLAETGGTA